MKSTEGNIVWIASYPKSGNTWVRVFLNQLLTSNPDTDGFPDLSNIPIASNRTLIDEHLGLKSSQLTESETLELRPEVYKKISKEAEGISMMKVHDAFGLTSGGNEIFPAENSLGAIYILRNPLDIVVSYASHTNASYDEIIARLNDSGYTISTNQFGLKAQLDQFLGSWSDHVRSWTEQKGIPVYTIRYEDLLIDPSAEFNSLLQQLNIPYDPARFDSAIIECEFRVLKEKEEVYGFREKPVQSGSFFRSGKKDTYKEHLNQEQIREVKKLHGKIMARFGY